MKWELGPSKRRTGAAQGIDARMWRWKETLSCPWSYQNEHINVLEARALCLAIRWRSRQAQAHGTRFLHLIDSQVVMGATAKGRSSARRLHGILMRTAAVTLAANFRPVLAYVRTHQNPADRPSRRVRTTFKRERRAAGRLALASW